jgi:ketosteroid isomerase-like protein
MTHSNVATVQRMYECFNRGDMETIRQEIFASDLVWLLARSPSTFRH